MEPHYPGSGLTECCERLLWTQHGCHNRRRNSWPSQLLKKEYVQWR